MGCCHGSAASDLSDIVPTRTSSECGANVTLPTILTHASTGTFALSAGSKEEIIQWSAADQDVLSYSSLGTSRSRVIGIDYNGSPVPMKLLQEPALGSFTPAYDPDPCKNFVFLVPGDEELFVGGGALNGAVGKLLLQQADQPIAFRPQGVGDDQSALVFDKTTCVYRRMHEKLFQKSASNVGGLVVGTKEDRSGTPVSFSGARTPTSSKHPFGAAFINIFKSDKRPYGCVRNVGLVYTVGPLGKNAKAEGEGPVEECRAALVKDSAEEFVAEVTATANNAICAILEYNAMQVGDLEAPQIEIVRVPIISGGIFKHPDVEKYEVALAVLHGIHIALSSAAESDRPEVELMPSPEMSKAYSLYREAFDHQSSLTSL